MMTIQLLSVDFTGLSQVGWRLANLDAMTVGIILLCSCVVYLLLNGGSNERKRRKATGVTLPPGQDLGTYMTGLDEMHSR